MTEHPEIYDSLHPMGYVFDCQTCHSAPHQVDHSELHQVAIGVLGMDWCCPDCCGWTRVRVVEANRGLTVEKGSAPAVRVSAAADLDRATAVWGYDPRHPDLFLEAMRSHSRNLIELARICKGNFDPLAEPLKKVADQRRIFESILSGATAEKDEQTRAVAAECVDLLTIILSEFNSGLVEKPS